MDRNESPQTKSSRIKKLLAGTALLALVLGAGVYGVFTASVSSTGNQFSSGTLFLDAGNGNGVDVSPVYFRSNAVPGDSGTTANSCPLVTNTGSVVVPNGNFKIYAGSLVGVPDTALTDEIDVTIQRGTGTATDCSDFVSSATIYTGTLTDFQTNVISYATGIDTGVGLNAAAAQRFRVITNYDVSAGPSSQGSQSGVQAVTWEART